jgi:hypothetical protein
MPERRALRLTVEALFLAALALALAFSDLRPLAIVGLMLLGWVVVALYEWVATREQPHYGAGLPPRYYVPQMSLPPPRPLEQLPSGYPASTEARDDAPTWIAPAAMRSEVLADWPVADPIPVTRADDTMLDDLIAVSVSEDEPAIDPWFDELDDPALASEPNAIDAQPSPALPEPAVDEMPADDEVEPDEDEREDEDAQDVDYIDDEEDEEFIKEEASADEVPEALGGADSVPVPLEPIAAPLAPRLERHRFDPLANGNARRRPWQPRVPDEGGSVTVPARPEHAGVLPGRSKRET